MAEPAQLSGISPISSVLNTMLNMAWQNQQNDKAYSRQRQLMQEQASIQESLYNRYFSPKAVADNLARIGVNPASYFGKGGSMAQSMPSVSAPGVSGTYGNSLPLENLGQSFASTLQMLTQAKKNTSEGSAIDRTLQHQIDLLISEKLSKDANTNYQNFLLDLHKQKLPRFLESQIEQNMKLAAFYSVSGKTQEAQAEYYKALKSLTEHEDVVKGEFALRAGQYVTNIMGNLQSQTLANKGAAASSYAHAENLEALTKTENEFRSARKRVLDAQGANEEEQNKVIKKQVDVLKNQLTYGQLQNALLEVEKRDKRAYSALHRLFFGKPERGDFKEAYKFFTTFDSDNYTLIPR